MGRLSRTVGTKGPPSYPQMQSAIMWEFANNVCVFATYAPLANELRGVRCFKYPHMVPGKSEGDRQGGM